MLLRASLELNFVRNLDKTLPLPLVVVVEREDCGGRYCPPWAGEHLIGESYYNSRQGIIQVTSANAEGNMASTLAHEFRHHWQAYQGVTFTHSKWDWLYKKYGYERAIRHYFTSSRTEWDALQFELKYAPSWVNEDWRRLLNLPHLTQTYFFPTVQYSCPNFHPLCWPENNFCWC